MPAVQIFAKAPISVTKNTNKHKLHFDTLWVISTVMDM